MTLVQSWIDSLTLLKPKNAQLFIMVTIKSIIEAYKLLFYYWWWVIVLMIACYVLPIVFPALEQGYMAGEFLDASRWLYQLLLFATCLATRPSIMQKNCAYFRSSIYKFSIILLLALIPKAFWPTALSPFYIFLILFFLDSAQGPKDFLLSMWNSLKMIVYNFPLLVIIGACFVFFGWLTLVLIVRALVNIRVLPEILMLIYNIFTALLLPIGVCTYANIYIKKLHDQFDLYFQSP